VSIMDGNTGDDKRQTYGSRLQLTSACLAVVNGFVTTAVEAFLAVVTVASISIVTTVDAHSSTDVSR